MYEHRKNGYLILLVQWPLTLKDGVHLLTGVCTGSETADYEALAEFDYFAEVWGPRYAPHAWNRFKVYGQHSP